MFKCEISQLSGLLSCNMAGCLCSVFATPGASCKGFHYSILFFFVTGLSRFKGFNYEATFRVLNHDNFPFKGLAIIL